MVLCCLFAFGEGLDGCLVFVGFWGRLGPLTVYSDPRKRSLAVALRPASLKCSVTPPPEGPRKRQHRLAAADSTLQNMGDAIAQLQQAALTLRDILQDLRSFV